MDPRDFLRLAHQLAGGNSPAHRRTAIGRAYCAAYNVAFDLLLSLGFRIERGHGAHEAVRDYVGNSGVDRIIHVSTQLRRLQSVRVKADYWMRDPQPEQAEVVARWLNEAGEMIRVLDAAAADPATRERMTRAIQAWERRTAGGVGS